VQEHIIDTLFYFIAYATQDKVDHDDEVLMAVFEHIIELRGKFTDSRLVKDK
jgi:hypothetical protein